MQFRAIFMSMLATTLIAAPAFAQTQPSLPKPTVTTATPVATSTATVSLPDASKGPAKLDPNAPVTHAELAELVEKVLMDNPDILMRVAVKAHDKQAADMRKNATVAMNKRHDDVYNDVLSPTFGDPKSDVTLVEFYDYHCGYCHQLMPSVVKLMGEDKKLRVVFKEFPILSNDSVVASRAALAVYLLDKSKYIDFHKALMQHKGNFDQASLTQIAEKTGIKAKDLQNAMNKPEISVELEKNRSIGDDLGVRGTPAIIIGDQLFPGALPYEDLKKLIADVRAGRTPVAPSE